jgi:hypothetical protein
MPAQQPFVLKLPRVRPVGRFIQVISLLVLKQVHEPLGDIAQIGVEIL